MIITMLWKNDLDGSTTSVIVDVPFLTSLEHLTEKADIVAKRCKRNYGYVGWSYVSCSVPATVFPGVNSNKLKNQQLGKESFQYHFCSFNKEFNL